MKINFTRRIISIFFLCFLLTGHAYSQHHDDDDDDNNTNQITVFSENFDSVVKPYTASAAYSNANCSNFIVATNTSVCDFAAYPIKKDASGNGKFLFEGTNSNGILYNDVFYRTNINNTLVAGTIYTIQLKIALANRIGIPILQASLNNINIGTVIQPTLVNAWQTVTFIYTPSADMVNPVLSLTNFQLTGIGNDFGIDNIAISYGTASLLPVHLIGFSAQSNTDDVILKWNTAVENNSNYFSVERSSDGETYTAIGSVNGSGTSSTAKAYTYTDKKPLMGTSYYRLRQVDIIGNFFYSPVVSIIHNSAQTAISAFPNPAINSFTVSVKNSTSTPYFISLTGLDGKVVLTKEVVSANGQLNVAIDSKIKPGLYVVTVNGNKQISFTKIVIQ